MTKGENLKLRSGRRVISYREFIIDQSKNIEL